MSIFALIRARCGLSRAEAAQVLDVRSDTVRSWDDGRRNAPAAVLDQLAALHRRIEHAADEALAQIDDVVERHGPAFEMALRVAGDDAEARLIGWPCVGAHQAVLGMVAARLIARGRTVRLD